MDRLAKAKVAIFGIGGVGGYVAEALARSGVGSFVLVDDDKVCLTNINRQIIATRKTIGQYKAEVMRTGSWKSTRTPRWRLESAFTFRKTPTNLISRSIPMWWMLWTP